MKKILSFVLVFSTIFICGCNSFFNTESNTSQNTSSSPQGEQNPLLTDAEWVGQDDKCENHIRFEKGNSFSSSCSCGEPIGNSDVVETYSYDSTDKTIKLYDSEGEIIETAKILFLDKSYLVLDVWNNVYTYANKNVALPTIHEEAKEQINTTQTFACLSVLGYEKDKIIVSSHDYDNDAADIFEKWELTAAGDIGFNSVSVVDDNGMVIVDDVTLSESEYQYIGDYYTYGFFKFNQNAEVTHVTFYGETIIQD